MSMDVEKVFHMNGGTEENSYTQNSAIQKMTSEKVKHITLKCLQETYITTTSKSLGIADLGCSSGQNSLSTIRDMVKAIDETSCKLNNIHPPEYQMYLNDLPTNDFNSIFKILPNFYTELKNERDQRSHDYNSNVYIGAYPGTFYGRLFPDKCLHFIYSYSSLHWLSKIPPGLYDKQGKSINKGSIYITNRSPEQVSKAYSDQFREDFSLFLESRSKELLAQGQMVLLFAGQSDQSHVDRGQSFIWELLTRSFATLVSKGEVKQEKVDEFETHFYTPWRNEIEEEIKREGSFEIEHFEMLEVELKVGDSISHGTTVARSIRAVQQSVISLHFGEEILDNLLENLARLVDEEMSKEDIRPIAFIVVLKKM